MQPGEDITFVCGTPRGGALDSTLALARIAQREGGVGAGVIAPSADPYGTNRLPLGLAIRSRRLGPVVERIAWRGVERLIQPFGAPLDAGGIRRARDVPAALQRRRGRPSLLVANSLRSLDLGRVIAIARRRETPVLWYLREASSLRSLPEWSDAVDGLVANSRPLAAAAAEMSGRPCAFVPSPIDTQSLVPPAVRSIVMLVNPVADHGVDVALELARLAPDVRIALQESWPLSASDRARLRTALSALPNVELRGRRARAALFTDAALLLAPHSRGLGPHRPKIALEAQLCGVPVIATNIPGLRELVASGELLVDPGAPASEWARVVRLALADLTRLSDVAMRFARSELVTEGEIWSAFSEACDSAIRSAERRP